MPSVHPSLVIGSSTEVIAGEKLIVTAGAVDAHIHFICPQQVQEALASGTTTMIGGGTGPSAGTSATTCTPSPFYMRHMLAATDGLPMNFAFTGKISSQVIQALRALGQKDLDEKTLDKVKSLLMRENQADLRHDIALAPAWISKLILNLLQTDKE